MAADAHGPQGVLSVLLVVPPVTAVTGFLPPQPGVSSRPVRRIDGDMGIRAGRVSGPGVAGRVGGPAMVGRAGQLAELESALGRVRDGTPTTVLVGGEAGIGKTRLVSEFTRCADGRILTGGCLKLGADGLPFAPFTALLRD